MFQDFILEYLYSLPNDEGGSIEEADSESDTESQDRTDDKSIQSTSPNWHTSLQLVF